MDRSRILTTLIGILLTSSLMSNVVSAQDEAPQAPAQLCSQDSRFNAFDFWVGSWNVYGAGSDELGGTNTIEKVEYDCLITESWTSATGTTGFSINYFNPVTGLWRQVWVSNGYSIDYTGGLNDKGSMVLEGEIYDYSSSRSSPFRGTWTPRENGTVRQLFELFNQESKEWGVWFDGEYRRQTQP